MLRESDGVVLGADQREGEGALLQRRGPQRNIIKKFIYSRGTEKKNPLRLAVLNKNQLIDNLLIIHLGADQREDGGAVLQSTGLNVM